MSITKMTLEELIRNYNENTKDNYEFEIKFFNLTEDIYLKILKSVSTTEKSFKDSLTYDILRTESKTLTKKTILDLLNQRKIYQVKEIIGVNYYDDTSKIQLSKETESQTQFDIADKDKLRIKLRRSFKKDNFIIDFTLTKTIIFEECKKKLIEWKKIITENKEIYNDKTGDILIPIKSLIDNYEIELEFDNSKKLEIEMVENIIKYFYGIMDPGMVDKILYQKMLKKCSDYINPIINPSFKRMINNVKSLTKNEYIKIYDNIKQYCLTEKYDGVRTIAFISEGKLYLIDQLSITSYDRLINSEKYKYYSAESIVDGEFMDGIFYIIDVMLLSNVDYSRKPFIERLHVFQKAKKLLNKFIKSDNKLFIEDINTETSFKSIWNSKDRKKDSDGLVLIDKNYSYHKTIAYKWKPSDKITIDFLCLKYKGNIFESKKGFTLYILFVGIANEVKKKLNLPFIYDYESLTKSIITKNVNYIPIQFSPSINPLAFLYYHPSDDLDLDKKIVEMSVGKDKQWKFYKIRDDRELTNVYYGNDFKVAENNLMTALNSLTIDELENINKEQFYFTKNSDEDFKKKNAFNRNILRTELTTLSAIRDILVDIGGGRGGDIHTYSKADFKKILFIDKDINALDEIASIRKYTISGGYENGKIFEKINGPNILIMEEDCNNPYEGILSKLSNIYGINKESVNCCISNFSFHYFCESEKSISNILNLISSILTTGGVFIYIVMDGKTIFDTFQSNQIVYGEKYSITREKSEEVFKNYGQVISVKMPFADTFYTEYLCNNDYIKKVAESKFSLERIKYEKCSNYNKKLFDELSQDDKDYLKLHTVSVYKKR